MYAPNQIEGRGTASRSHRSWKRSTPTRTPRAGQAVRQAQYQKATGRYQVTVRDGPDEALNAPSPTGGPTTRTTDRARRASAPEEHAGAPGGVSSGGVLGGHRIESISDAARPPSFVFVPCLCWRARSRHYWDSPVR